jgi:2-oxoisovalerate dehydrogenase E1 component
VKCKTIHKKVCNKLNLLTAMLESREGDLREIALIRQGKGRFQLSSLGHEAMVAVGLVLQEDDFVFPYPRDRALVLSRGVTTYQLALEFFAKRGSSSAGRQLQSHFCDRSRNIWSVPSPTGSALLPACGVAWGMQLRGQASTVLATVGDAGCRQGECFEAFAFAVERKLPIVFIVEDNGFGISTNTAHMTPLTLGLLPAALVRELDGRDPEQLAEATDAALSRARAGHGPTIIWCRLDRLGSHSNSDDHRRYRSQEELALIETRDPVRTYAERLQKDGVMTAAQWEALQAEIRQRIIKDYDEAEQAEEPSGSEILLHLYGLSPKVQERPPVPQQSKCRIIDAIQTVFHEILQRDSRVVWFGEDIEDPKGGVFGLTQGLSTAAPNRVFNSPLAEATIIGVACGLASFGFRPIVELQFIDFAGPALNQIFNNLATLRWRSVGQWCSPVVMYAPYGAYLPGGSIWHSQANEAVFCHVPGLRVAVPSTPADAAGLFWTAFAAEDPTLILLPKHLFRVLQELEPPPSGIPVGQAFVRRRGADVTVIAWGNTTEVALQAAEALAGEISLEVIDLRWLAPWDRDTVGASLGKTGRLVVVQEDTRCCSVGQMIISEIVEDPRSWGELASRPQLVSRVDTHIGFNPTLEYAALPDVSLVIEAIKTVMR